MSRSLGLKSLALSLALSCLALVGRASAQQNIAGVDVFPANNVWNTKIDGRSPDANSGTYVSTMGGAGHFHPDWGTNPTYGIPYNIVVDGKKPLQFLNMTFDYADESDAGPYPINKKLKIEGDSWSLKKNGGDRHVLMIHPPSKMLYETFYTTHKGGYHAGSGAIFNLATNSLRPDGWTSADAAGLPVFPALVNYDETAAAAAGGPPIKHAFRMTCSHSKSYVWPARHFAGSQINGWPPLGKRLRLKSGFNISSFSAMNKAILTAMKEYGLFIADHGSNWYVQGTSDPRWDDDDLNALKTLTGNDFEFIDETPMIINPDSAQANP